MTTTYSGQKWSVDSKTADYTLIDTDYLVLADTSGGGFVLMLPVAPDEGRAFKIKKTSAVGVLVIDGNGNTIDGSGTADITTNQDAVHLVFHMVGWVIV